MAIKKKQSILKPLKTLFVKFHLMIFFVFIVGALSWAVWLINQTLYNPEKTNYTSTITAGTIDEATLERIQSLHTSDQISQPSWPAGRVNPFSE